jgi:hypothetical protein
MTYSEGLNSNLGTRLLDDLLISLGDHVVLE